MLSFSKSLTLNDYQKLTSSGSFGSLLLSHCEIINADGTVTTVEKLLENLSHLKIFHMLHDLLTFQPDTVKKMVQHLKRFENLYSLALSVIEETFDFSSFVDYLMKNETTYIHLSFRGPAAYKEMVENAVEEIKKNPSLKVPDIQFRE